VKSALFRAAQPSDWDSIRKLLMESRLPTNGAREHLDTFLVASNEDRLAACGGLELYGDAALLRSVAVSSPHRSKGLGRELVHALLTQASSRNVHHLVLLTDTAEAFFLHLGFETVDRSQFPAAVMASEQFRGACPASATAMRLALGTPAK